MSTNPSKNNDVFVTIAEAVAKDINSIPGCAGEYWDDKVKVTHGPNDRRVAQFIVWSTDRGVTALNVWEKLVVKGSSD